MRVLQDIRIAGPVDFPDSGVPQDTRLAFKALALAPGVDLSVLIHPDFRTRRMEEQVRRDPTAAAAMLLNGSGLLHGGVAPPRRPLSKLRFRLERWLRQSGELPVAPVHPAMADAIWRRYLERSLAPGDRDLLNGVAPTISSVTEEALLGRGPDRQRRLDTRGFDAVLFPEPRLASITPGTMKVIRCHDLLPLVAGDLFPPGVSETFHGLMRRCAEDSYFVCNSEPTRAALVKLFPALEARSAVAPCALADAGYRSDLPVEDIVRQNLAPTHRGDAGAGQGRLGPSGRYLLMVSTIEPRKDHLTALEAYQVLRARLPVPPRLVIVGKPGLHADRVLAAMRPLVEDGSVLHLTGVPRPQLNQLYARAQAVLFPSLDEGFGYAPLEALSNGTPSVVSDVPAHRWTLGDAALYAPPRDVLGLARQLELLVAAPDRAGRRADLLCRAARVLARFDPAETAGAWSRALHGFHQSARPG